MSSKEQELIIIRGLPGSGKSTKAKELITEIDWAIHCEADMFHVIGGKYCFNLDRVGDGHKWCQAETALWLNRGRTVIVSNTYTTMAEMQPYLDLAERYDVAVRVIEMKGDWGSIHGVPEPIIKKMAERWEEYE